MFVVCCLWVIVDVIYARLYWSNSVDPTQRYYRPFSDLPLFPPKKTLSHSQYPQRHNRISSQVDSLMRETFLTRMLNNIWTNHFHVNQSAVIQFDVALAYHLTKVCSRLSLLTGVISYVHFWDETYNIQYPTCGSWVQPPRSRKRSGASYNTFCLKIVTNLRR